MRIYISTCKNVLPGTSMIWCLEQAQQAQSWKLASYHKVEGLQLKHL